MATTKRRRDVGGRGPGRPPKEGGPGAQVRIRPDLAARAKVVARERGVSVVDLLSGLIEPGLAEAAGLGEGAADS